MIDFFSFFISVNVIEVNLNQMKEEQIKVVLYFNTEKKKNKIIEHDERS